MSKVQDTPIYCFGDFTLDATNRELLRENERLELNARYFDALVLLVREHGRLVEKDRFFDEVWDDVVVSDSALTQCIKEVRRQLGDDAANPRFIQTVPRHGYRFIADVTVAERSAVTHDPGRSVPTESMKRSAAAEFMERSAAADSPERSTDADSRDSSIPAADVTGFQGDLRDVAVAEGDGSDFTASPADRRESAFSKAMATTLAGTLGGAIAGLLGGLLYGLGLASSPMLQELGTTSILLVLMSLTGFLGTVGAFGISAGMASADYASGGQPAWRIVGAVLGGMLVGGSVKLLGVDAFNLLFGRTPAGITGGIEGAALGFAVGMGAHLGRRFDRATLWRPVAAAAATGAVTGVLIALSGGHLMGGSLDLLAQSFSESRLQLDTFGRYFGEVRFGRTTQVILAGLEGLTFAACVVGALVASGLPRSARQTHE